MPIFYSAGILEQFMGARNRVGIGLSCRPAWLWLHRLAESIPGLLESLKTPSLETMYRITKNHTPKIYNH